ncbi:ead/Ea22-like family protein [Rahnella inusitata]|uniref:ead/Ea22-like family protein n=1 Tax=Rahnella inusitata TaxID=58169 RepID=UPI001BC85A9C|nr:ead/Ea22-like family protein [Rahnella inusitata]QUT17671.1 ead/Ea22-like family protein [Rahnella inusitata]
MTDKTDIAALREAALKATPGNWKLGIGSTYAYVQATIDMKLGGRSWVKLCHVGRAGWRNQQSTIDDARFIALANPATILALLDQLEAERQTREAFESAAFAMRDEMRQQRKRAEKAELELIKPLPIGELIQRLEGQTYEKWFSQSDLKGDQVPMPIDADIIRDANRYRFLRDEDSWGEDSDSWDVETRTGLISSENLMELRLDHFDAAIDARMATSDIPFLNPVTTQQKPVISKEKLCDWLEDNFDIDDSQCDAFANCFARHCNCIVKEGE